MIRNRLLFNENPLVILPELATKVGLNESIVLQQINYWLNENEKARRNFKDCHYWCYNSYKEWQTNFPFWSESTIKRTISKLENCGLIITGNYNKLKIDRTKWYRLNDELLSKVEESPLGQIDLSIVSKWSDEQFKLTLPLPENNTEINNKDYHNIKGSFKKQNELDIRYKSKDDFLKDINLNTDSNIYKISELIYRNFMAQLGCNHYKLNKEQKEKMIDGLKLIDELTEDWEQVRKIINQYFRLERAYYTIQDLTNHNTLAYLFSLTGIAEITERFDSDGKWQGII